VEARSCVEHPTLPNKISEPLACLPSLAVPSVERASRRYDERLPRGRGCTVSSELGEEEQRVDMQYVMFCGERR
jgi:hypothetical protein